jgi:hypothetical protein
MACISEVTCRHFSMRNGCISGDKKGAAHIRLNSDIFLAQFAKTNWIFEFLLRKYQIKKKNRPKRSPGSEVMIILKSTKFQHFSRNDRTVFKVSSKLYLDILHYKKRKWICVDISMMHLLHQIHADIYIFNKIFNEHKLAQLRGLLGVKDKVA